MPDTIDTIKSKLDAIAQDHPTATISYRVVVIEEKDANPIIRGIVTLDPSAYPIKESYEELQKELETLRQQGQVIRYGFLVMVDELPDYAKHPELSFDPLKG